MNSTHINDVVFTRDSLNKFIKLIKTEGIKNLDYYIMSPDLSVTNVLGNEEFSLGEKTLFSGNLAIVNKSYYNDNPYVKLAVDDNDKNLKILKYNLKNIFHFPFDETSGDTITIESVSDDDPESNMKQIVVNKKISTENYKILVNPSREDSFGYSLDSNIIFGLNNFVDYALIEQGQNGLYKYYQSDFDKLKINNYTEYVPIPYEFSSIEGESAPWTIKKFDGQSDFSNTRVSAMAANLDTDFNFYNINNLYYEGLEKVKYDQFVINKDENDLYIQAAADNQNIDIISSKNGGDPSWNITNTSSDNTYPCFDPNDPLLKAFQQEYISDIEETNFTGNKLSNFYQIFWGSTDDHLLTGISIKNYAYGTDGAAKDITVQLMYNKTIPVKSIKIKSWEPLSLLSETKVFPNIEDTGYSAPYHHDKTISGKWQPNDLVNLFSAYQVLKGNQVDIGDTNEVRAFSVSSTTTNAHQIAFTPNNFDLPVSNTSVYAELNPGTSTNAISNKYKNYNQFEYIVLDIQDYECAFSTASSIEGIQAFNADISELATGTKVHSALISGTSENNQMQYTIQYYNATTACTSATGLVPIQNQTATTAVNQIIGKFSDLKDFSFPIKNSTISSTKINNVWNAGWGINYVLNLSKVQLNINNNSNGNNSAKFIFNFQPIEVTKTTSSSRAILTANVNTTVQFIINAPEVNTQSRIPIYVIPLGGTKLTFATSTMYNNQIFNANKPYYGLFMQNQIESDGSYDLIGYLPQSYFWETDLLNKSKEQSTINKEECAKAWKILLQDRLNNAVNNSLLNDEGIKTRFVDLHKDLNIFDIVLSSSTKSDGTPIPVSSEGFYTGDLGLYMVDSCNTARQGIYRLQYNPTVVDTDTLNFFSNYTNFNIDLSSNTPFRINTIEYVASDTADPVYTTYNNMFTAEYIPVNASDAVTMWKNKLYGTKGSPKPPSSTTNIASLNETDNSIQFNDYFLYMSNQSITATNKYEEVNRAMEIPFPEFHYQAILGSSDDFGNYKPGKYYIKNTENGNDNYILSNTLHPIQGVTYYTTQERESVINSLKALPFYYQQMNLDGNDEIEDAANFTIHPSILNNEVNNKDFSYRININNNEQQIITKKIYNISYYKELSLRPYEANKYAYYAKLPIETSETLLSTIRSAYSGFYLYYKYKIYQSIKKSDESIVSFKSQNSYYVLSSDDSTDDPYISLNIVDQQDYSYYIGIFGAENIYYINNIYYPLTDTFTESDYNQIKNDIDIYVLTQDSNNQITLNRQYYYNEENDGDDDSLIFIKNFYTPNTYYYYDGTNYILDSNNTMDPLQQYYQLITLDTFIDTNMDKTEEILERLDTRLYKKNEDSHVMNIKYENNIWTNNSGTNITNIPAFYVYLIDEEELLYTNNLNDLLKDSEIDSGQNKNIKVLQLKYDYVLMPKEYDENYTDDSIFIARTDNTTNVVKILFKYPVFAQKTSDQDDLYTPVNPLDMIITDPSAGVDYYQKKYKSVDSTLQDSINVAISHYPPDNSSDLTNILKMYLSQELGLQKYYYWDYESRRGKECNGNFSVELAKNPYVCASKVNWHWTYGENEKAEALNSITFSTSTTKSKVANIITPVYDYMTLPQAEDIFKKDSYKTNKNYGYFTEQLTMNITDKVRTADTISLSGQRSSQTISTVNSATNVPKVFMLHKLLNRKNYFNLNYTTNYDYMHNKDAINTTATHKEFQNEYQHQTGSMIKNINFFNIEEQYQIFSTTTGTSTTASRNYNDKKRYLTVGDDNVTALSFTSYPLTSTASFSASNNKIMPALVNVLNTTSTNYIFTPPNNESSSSDSTEENPAPTDNFDEEKLLIRYLDNKKNHEPIIKDSTTYLNKDAWLLLGAQRSTSKTYAGTLDYLYLTPEAYYFNNKEVYIYFIYTLYYASDSPLTNITLNQDCCIYCYKNNDNYVYGYTVEHKIFNNDITEICHLKDQYDSKHIGLQKIYEAYFQGINYWYMNPYPAGGPVFFQNWCKSGKKLTSTKNNKETESRDYYYYSVKLPNKLNVEKSDTFYQYPYKFDIEKSDHNSAFTDKEENNHFLVTYTLIEDDIPQSTYDSTSQVEDKGFKDSDNNSYTLYDFLQRLKNTLNKTDAQGVKYKYYFAESASETLSITNHDDVFKNDNKVEPNNLKFKFYANSDSTYEKPVYIKLQDTAPEGIIKKSDIKGKYYQINNNNSTIRFTLENRNFTINNLAYDVYISDKKPGEDEFTKYQLYQYLIEGGNIPNSIDPNEENFDNLRPYSHYTQTITQTLSKALPNELQISLPFEYTDNNPLYLEKFESTLGFRHTFLNLPNKKYTNSYTKDNPFPNQVYYLDSDGCLRDENKEDKSPNGTFSISSGTLDPGVLVQIRGFNDLGEYTGDLNGGTLNNVTFGNGVLHVKDTTDAWRKPVIDVINAVLKVKPKNQGGNIYASIVTEGGISAAKKIKGERLYGAIWNDYAEYRQTDNIEPGRCVIETGTGALRLSSERLQGGANIISDTFGMGVGETEKAKTPIAVSGRALAYPYEDKAIFKPGDAVCSGPNGTVSIMTREEIKEWPDRIVGYVSEIPYYESWGTGNVKVNGRIWIKIH